MNSKQLAQSSVIWLSIAGAIVFFLLTTLAMKFYPGGTIHQRMTEGYDFWNNYFSDLGRTRSWNGDSNFRSNLLFKSSLSIVGGSLILFFLILPTLFKNVEAQFLSAIAAIAGIVAAGCYIGIAWTPLNVDYRLHTFYVRSGFIAFLAMSFFYTMAIRNEPAYPNRYASVFLIFCAILFIQVFIMLFGPRSWSSMEALRLQATAQKIVVYAEISCMLYQCFGALGMIKKKINF